jgi:D-glycero-D-manno-heptose 1,7-bisphosphate phosphatase
MTGDNNGPAAIFLDRDGVINPLIIREGQRTSPRSMSEWQIFSDVEPSLQRLRDAGYLLLVITNQPEIARKQSDPRIVNEFHQELLSKRMVNAIKMCPHDDADNCACRKPRPGMIIDHQKEMGVDLSRSFVIGDTWKDVNAGAAAGVCTILLRREYSGDAQPDYELSTLTEAVDLVLRGSRT